MVWRTKLTVVCFLLLGTETADCSVQVQCPVSPVGALHPVQGFLEQFGAGLGCAAQETGEKETHVISLGRAGAEAQKRVTVILRPISISRPPNRTVTVVLSSQNPLHWQLEGVHLPDDLSILAQVALPSTVQSHIAVLQVEHVPVLPWHPRALLHWSLEEHGAISSLTHAPIANRVYIRLGEDPTMPSVCKLQPLFLSQNYLTSDLRPQVVRGCVPSDPGPDPEVHVIRLQSAGSGMRGALQVEVSVSLLPPVAGAGWHRVVLILCSAEPVNWALVARGLRGQITVYAPNWLPLPEWHGSYGIGLNPCSSNSMSPIYPPEPDLTLMTIPSPDLPVTHDLLGWANGNGFPKVTSYTEADLANRFVIRLAGGGTDGLLSPRSLVLWPQRPPVEMQERGLREWLSEDGDWRGRSREAMAVQCHDGQLSVAMDSSILQSQSLPATAITLREHSCAARSNGSHLLLEYPVISCGTEAVMENEPRGVLYKNMVLFWRGEVAAGKWNKSERGNRQPPFVIHFSCFVAVPGPPAPLDVTPLPQTLEDLQGDPAEWAVPGATVFSLQLFGTDEYQEKATGPCVIMANNRVYVQVSVAGVERGGVEVQSCVVSPLSDPDASPGWAVIQDSCLIEPTFQQIQNGGNVGKDEADGAGAPRTLRFSFVLKPIYVNPVQFLHCRLQYCKDGPPGAPTRHRCMGRPHLAPLIAQPHSQQCEFRYLLRPMLVVLPLGRAQHSPSAGSGVNTVWVVGVSFAAFLIGIGLMGSLWCIYTRTGITQPLSRGSPLEPADQTTVAWTPSAQVEQSNSSM